MSRASQPKIILQLIAIALHSLLFGAFVLATQPEIGDRLSVATPLHESRLATLNEFTGSATITRSVKRADGSQATGLAFAVFYPAQVQRFSRLRVHRSATLRHRTVWGLLPIRSPPLASSR